MSNVPNKQQTVEFNGYMMDWQKKLNLSDWRIIKVLKSKAKDAMADISISFSDRLACWRLGDFGSHVIDSQSLEDTALHETLHVLLAELIAVSKDVNAGPDLLASAEHRVIITLLPLLLIKEHRHAD